MKQVGIIGAGIMATGMTHNFLKNGYTVSVWNRTKEHLQKVLADGAAWCDSPKLVTESSDIIIECVSDDEASKQVWTNPETGILAGAAPSKILIASSSLSLHWTDELNKRCIDREFNFLDMPLTGSRAGAEGGTLTLLIGGDAETLSSIKQDLGVISEKIYHFGPAGAGMRFKLVLNTLIGIQVNAAAQAVELARKAGLDIATVQNAIFEANMGPASPSTAMLFTNMDMPPEQVNFALKWIEKDLRYAQAMAKRYGVDFDLLDATQANFFRAKEAGYGNQDLTKISNIYR